MKLRLIILLFFFPIIMMAQDAIVYNHPKYYQDGDYWVQALVPWDFEERIHDYETAGSGENFSLYFFYVEGDTIIDNKEYKCVHAKTWVYDCEETYDHQPEGLIEGPQVANVLFMREDADGKQWRRLAYLNDEALLFDFSHPFEKGQVIRFCKHDHLSDVLENVCYESVQTKAYSNSSRLNKALRSDDKAPEGYLYYNLEVSNVTTLELPNGEQVPFANGRIAFGWGDVYQGDLFHQFVPVCESFSGRFLYRVHQGQVVLQKQDNINRISSIIGTDVLSLFDKPEGYHPFVEEGKVWNMLSQKEAADLYPDYEFSYFIKGDTLISDLNCKKLYSYNENNTNQTIYKMALYEINKKIYFIPEGSETAHLLYDFGIPVGSTVYMADVIHPEWELEMKNNSDSIVKTGEISRHCLLVNRISESFVFPSGWWIEGIGSELGPLNTWGFEAAGNSVFLLNCEIDGQEIFNMSGFMKNTVEVAIDNLNYFLNLKTHEAILTAYHTCSGEVNIPSEVNYNGETFVVKSMLWCSFCNNQEVTKVRIPKTLVNILHYYPYDPGMQNPPAGMVDAIHMNPFKGCTALESIEVDEENTSLKSVDGVLFSQDGVGQYYYKTNNYYGTGLYCYPEGAQRKSYAIPDGVEWISSEAFFQNQFISTLTIPNSIKQICGNAFQGCSNLADVYCYANNVPVTFTNVFDNFPIASATLHVPEGSIEKYKATSPWKDFGNIVALGAQYNVNAQELTVSDIQDSICKPIIDQTQKPLTIVLTKEGSDLLVKLLYYENNPYTTGFDIASSMSFGSNEVPDSVSIDIEPIIPDPYKYYKLGLMPYNVWFTVHGLEISSFYLSCWWYKGFVELTEGEPLVLEYKIETADINGATYDLLKVMHKAMLKKWQGEGEFRIPSEVSFEGETYKVTCLDTYPFGDKMTKVTIPKTICSMSFDDSNSIFFNPFVPCRSLEWIEVEEDCPLFSSADGVLFNKDKTRLVGYPEASPRESYTVPENVTYIYSNAFNYLQHLKNLTIPDAVKELYSGSFLGSVSLEKVKLPSRLEVLEQYLFKNCQNLKSVEIPKGIAFIMNQAFEGCSSLNNITLPEGVTVIMDETFKDCSGLTIINLPQSLTTIERSVFMGCSALQILDIPESVNHIGSDAFNGCKMNSLCIRGALESSCMIRGLFSGMDQQTKVYVPASLIDRYKKIYSGEVLPLEEYVNSVSYTKDQMATIILPSAPDASKGKYYGLDRCEEGKIIFTEELQPKARTPYIIVPKEDFTIDLSKLELESLLSDTVSVKGAMFIGSYNSAELNCQEGFYIDIIDATPDCQIIGTDQRKAAIGALRAFLVAPWDDPYTQGPTKGIKNKREIVLQDDPNGMGSIHNSQFIIHNDDAIYDLSGRRLSGKPSRGVYIKNYRKVAIK